MNETELSHVEREIDRFLDLWKHTDSRVAGNWTVLAAVTGAAVSFAALYGRTASSDGVVALVAGLVCACSFLTGFRVVGTDLTKTEYIVAVNMLRARIATAMPSVRPSMFIPPLDVDESTNMGDVLRDYFSQRLPKIPQRFLFSFTGLTGGYAACSALLALRHSGPRLAPAITVGCVAGAAIGVAQARAMRSYAAQRIAWALGRFDALRLA